MRRRTTPIRRSTQARRFAIRWTDWWIKLRPTPAQAFKPELLAALRQEDFTTFERLRANLKKAVCRMTALDHAFAELAGDRNGRGLKQADILMKLARSAHIFHGPDGVGVADLDVNGHRETWPTRSERFRSWLARRFYNVRQGAPSSEALQSVLNVIEAKAHFDAPERAVYVRIGSLNGKLYIDLGDEAWRAWRRNATSWRVIAALNCLEGIELATKDGRDCLVRLINLLKELRDA